MKNNASMNDEQYRRYLIDRFADKAANMDDTLLTLLGLYADTEDHITYGMLDRVYCDLRNQWTSVLEQIHKLR